MSAQTVAELLQAAPSDAGTLRTEDQPCDEAQQHWPNLIALAQRTGYRRDVGECEYDFLQRAIRGGRTL